MYMENCIETSSSERMCLLYFFNKPYIDSLRDHMLNGLYTPTTLAALTKIFLNYFKL